MVPLLLCEELFLITHDDRGRSTSSSPAPDSALAGALLLDLAERGLIKVDDKKRVSAAGGTVTDALLTAALAAITGDKRERTVRQWVSKLPGKVRPLGARVGDALVERGVLRRERYRSLGLFPATRWPVRDEAIERDVRDGLRRVLVEGAEPTPHQALLVPLLAGQHLVRRLVDRPDRTAATATVKTIVADAKAGKLVSASVSEAVRDTQAAIMMAMIMPAVIASTTGATGS